MTKKLLTVGRELPVHVDADGLMQCTVCGGYRHKMTAEVWTDLDRVIIDWREDRDFEDHEVLPVCDHCAATRFSDQAVCWN